jgi:hypothetical protein
MVDKHAEIVNEISPNASEFLRSHQHFSLDLA